jgi:hypothetical protein
MAVVGRDAVLSTVAEIYGDAAESALAEALAEAGLEDQPSFDAEEVDRLGQALIGRAGRLAAEHQSA